MALTGDAQRFHHDGRLLCKMIACCGLILTTSSCTLKTPGCGNRDVKAGIEEDARTSVKTWLGNQSQPADASFVVSGSYETSRSGNTRSCSATVTVGSGQDHVAVQIEYEVIATDDGQVMYRWDELAFGKSFVGSAMLQILQGMSKAPTAGDDTAKSAPDAAAQAPSENIGNSHRADRQQADDPSEVDRWRDGVTTMINSQASKFPIDGSGSVLIGFDVLANGDIRDVKVEKSSGNAGLDATAVQMAEKAGQVSPPPGQRNIHMSMKLSFL